MSKVCEITGKKGQSGNRVSHANNKSRHTFQPNPKNNKLFLRMMNKYVNVRLSAHGLKKEEKKGPYRALKDAGLI